MNMVGPKRLSLQAGAFALCALLLAACVDSSDPILTDAQSVFGPKFQLQFFSLRKGVAYDPERATYVWNGTHYIHASGGMDDVRAFSVHPFEGGDYIVQSVPGERERTTEYALLHTLADGVYLLTPVDEDDADNATRAANCRKVGQSSCRIETQAQLFALARASAARRKDTGGLVIRLPDHD